MRYQLHRYLLTALAIVAGCAVQVVPGRDLHACWAFPEVCEETAEKWEDYTEAPLTDPARGVFALTRLHLVPWPEVASACRSNPATICGCAKRDSHDIYVATDVVSYEGVVQHELWHRLNRVDTGDSDRDHTTYKANDIPFCTIQEDNNRPPKKAD